MRFLLDTHVYLWYIAGSDRLSVADYSKISNAEAVFVSAASVWESAIKAAIGKLDADLDELVSTIAGSGFKELPVVARQARLVADLPRIHNDPFDRILIAQAVDVPLRFLTAEARLREYSDLVELINSQ